MINALGVTKHYGARLALDSVSLRHRTGPSPASSDRMAPAKRRIPDRVGADAGRHGPYRYRPNGSAAPTLGVLPHVPGLYGRLTVREHIAYFGALRGMRGGALRRASRELIDQLDLSAAADFRREPSRRADREGRARGRARAQASAPDSR